MYRIFYDLLEVEIWMGWKLKIFEYFYFGIALK